MLLSNINSETWSTEEGEELFFVRDEEDQDSCLDGTAFIDTTINQKALWSHYFCFIKKVILSNWITIGIISILADLFVFQAGNQCINIIIFVAEVFQFVVRIILIVILFRCIVGKCCMMCLHCILIRYILGHVS